MKAAKNCEKSSNEMSTVDMYLLDLSGVFSVCILKRMSLLRYSDPVTFSKKHSTE
jgi:hypothetical protein